MITNSDVQKLTGATVYGSDGNKIGSVGQVYLDNRTDDPQWVTVKTGLFGTKETFVPLDNARLSGERVEVPYSKDQVKGAPRIDEDGELSSADENELYRHYGLTSADDREADDREADGRQTGRQTDRQTDDRQADDRQADRQTDDRETGTRDAAAEGDGVGGPGRHRSDDGAEDNAMTRSEERLVAGTRTENAGKARLRKHIVTERQQVDVPVRREEVRLEREPVAGANRDEATSGSDLGESEHEVILHAERPVVNTETVPVERVRLAKETVTDQQRVSGEVRKEQIDFQGDEGRGS
ncbi:DUF2382 domain-containing protein [Actinoplanes sp. NPDC051343]|uniref:PRC and DUF2382 domain-containing protein n=1 Tax=Actinoplanes sp. NPDC051343 TaxID=3363906 RepID=UPI0037BC75F3